MANKKISQLTAVTPPLTGAEIVPLVQSSTKRTTTQQIADLATTVTPVSGSSLTSTTVSGQLAELDARDFMVKREAIQGDVGGGLLTNTGLTTTNTSASLSVFFPTGAQSLLLDTVASEITSAGATNTNVNIRASQTLSQMYRVCSGSALNGGFLIDQVFGFKSGATRADQRVTVGLLNATSNPTANVDPSTFVDCFFLGKDSADTNLSIMNNDGAGTCTKTDLGVALTALAGKLLRFRVRAPVGGGNMTYDLHNITDNVHYTGSIGTNLPTTDVELYQYVGSNTGPSTATPITMRVVKLTQFTNYQ